MGGEGGSGRYWRGFNAEEITTDGRKDRGTTPGNERWSKERREQAVEVEVEVEVAAASLHVRGAAEKKREGKSANDTEL